MKRILLASAATLAFAGAAAAQTTVTISGEVTVGVQDNVTDSGGTTVVDNTAQDSSGDLDFDLSGTAGAFTLTGYLDTAVSFGTTTALTFDDAAVMAGQDTYTFGFTTDNGDFVSFSDGELDYGVQAFASADSTDDNVTQDGNDPVLGASFTLSEALTIGAVYGLVEDRTATAPAQETGGVVGVFYDAGAASVEVITNTDSDLSLSLSGDAAGLSYYVGYSSTQNEFPAGLAGTLNDDLDQYFITLGYALGDTASVTLFLESESDYKILTGVNSSDDATDPSITGVTYSTSFGESTLDVYYATVGDGNDGTADFTSEPTAGFKYEFNFNDEFKFHWSYVTNGTTTAGTLTETQTWQMYMEYEF